MAIFAVIVQTAPEGDGLAVSVQQHFPDANYQLDGGHGWLVAAKATAQQVSDTLGITNGKVGAALVFEVASYFGRANPNIWTWIKGNWEAGRNG
jgi:hypothetical protein